MKSETRLPSVETIAFRLSDRYAETVGRLDKLDDEFAEAWLTRELTGQEADAHKIRQAMCWQEMRFLRQAMHRTGLYPDPLMTKHQAHEREMRTESQDAALRQKTLSDRIAELKQDVQAAFEEIQPQAERALAELEQKTASAITQTLTGKRTPSMRH